MDLLRHPEHEEGQTMKVLLGTTNPSKVKHFEELLSGCDIEFCTLRDLGITREPEETGKDP